MSLPAASPNPFERLDLHRLRSRPGTKWQRTPGALAAWVADMDLAPAGIIRRRLFEMIGRGDLGYPHWPRGEGSPGPRAFAHWASERYGWQITEPHEVAHIIEFCDVVQAIQVVLHLCAEPGDGVVLHTPAYPPMYGAIASAGCTLIDVPLDEESGSDLGSRIEAAISAARVRPKVLVLCHPHNPLGRVFSREELNQFAQIAERHDLVIISDEIHADLRYESEPHLPMAAVSEGAAQRTVTIHSASKAFNLAGLRYAIAHVGPESIRERYASMPSHLFGAPNIAGVTAAVAAWTEPAAADWLKAVRSHLDAQRLLLAELLGLHLPEVVYRVPQATYLAWLDVRALGLGNDPSEFWRSPDRGADRVDLSPGPDFGRAGYVRLNFATSANILEQIVTSMARGLRAAARP